MWGVHCGCSATILQFGWFPKPGSFIETKAIFACFFCSFSLQCTCLIFPFLFADTPPMSAVFARILTITQNLDLLDIQVNNFSSYDKMDIGENQFPVRRSQLSLKKLKCWTYANLSGILGWKTNLIISILIRETHFPDYILFLANFLLIWVASGRR